jgi:excisionase family DNA binding protein
MRPPLASDSTSELLTVEEVAAKLRVPQSWVYSHADELGAMRLGKYLRFDWQTVMGHLRTGISTGKGGQN